MQLHDRRLLELVTLIYDAAQDPALWKACLKRLSDSVGGRGAILLHHDLTSGGVISESIDIAPEALRLYGSHYHSVDPWARSLRTQELLKPGRAIPDQWLVPRSEVKRTEHYTDFSHRFDLSRMASLSLFRGRYHSGISLLRSERDSEFCEQELRFLEKLIPHVQRALHINAKLAAVALELHAQRDGLDALPCAFVVTGPDARVLSANRLAAQLTLANEGIAIVGGTLTAAVRASRVRIQGLCASTARRDSHLEAGGSLRLTSPGGVPIHILIVPTSRAAPLDLVGPKPCALIFISDPSRNQPLNEVVLQGLFDLTRAQAKVAALLALGHSLEAIAEQRDLTIETVRWYNKQILGKVGCHSRGELVRLLGLSLASLQMPIDRSSDR